jgi:K+-sensing histidine kinase KdpD
MGIGLSVVAGAVQAMGGEVAAERGSVGGLAVVLRVPVAPLPAEEGPA